MERREFIKKIVCSLVGAWPLAAGAQQPGNQRLIGVLGADATAWAPWTVALTARACANSVGARAILWRSSIAGPREDPIASVNSPLNSNGARLTSSSPMAPPLRS